jgi:hypothetical protein
MNTSLRNSIKGVIKTFDPILLDDMGSVRLMSRMDTKYVLNLARLPEILSDVASNYFILEIEGDMEQVYETQYFDSLDYAMYTCHHNRKLNRNKIRVRKYTSTEEKFFEIKFKNNKGRTIKKRTRDEENNASISENQYRFIEETTSFKNVEMKPSLKNSFTRLTLVNKDFSERITIDYNLWFQDSDSGNETLKDEICIVEVKRGRSAEKSVFMKVLDKNRIRSMGFSKYCMGLVFTNSELKKNRFKQRVRKIDKLLKN